MCQVYGPSARVACGKCGAGYYEDSAHICKRYKSFEQWDAELQKDAREPIPRNASSLIRTLHNATRRVARWAKWKRHCAWADEYQFCIGRPKLTHG
jgi:hypothetical protein